MTTNQILEKLDKMEKDISYIKKHMIDADSILTAEETERLEESLQEFKEGKTTSLENFEKEMKRVRHPAR